LSIINFFSNRIEFENKIWQKAAENLDFDFSLRKGIFSRLKMNGEHKGFQCSVKTINGRYGETYMSFLAIFPEPIERGKRRKHRVKDELFRSWKVKISDDSAKATIMCRKSDFDSDKIVNRVERICEIAIDYRNNRNPII